MQPSVVENSAPGHLRALDGLRGLAILLVLLAHCSGKFKSLDSDPPPLRFLLDLAASYGSFGVDLFFVLSGFLITRILLSTRNHPRYLKNFYTRRVLRIFPIYYGFLVLCLFIVPWIISYDAWVQLFGEPKYHIWLWLYGTNVIKSMIQQDLFHSLEHFWSLAVEEHFYLFWPFLVLVLARPTLGRLCLYLTVVAVIFRVFFNMVGHSVGAYVFTLCRIDGLALGAFIAILEQEIGYKHSEIRIPRGFIVATILLFVAVCLSGGNGVFVPSLSSFLFALMVLAAVKYKLFQRPFEAGALTFLGLYSYGVYVYHLPLLFVLEKFFPQVLALTNNRVLDVILFFAIGCGSSLLVAFLSYHLIEKHFLKLKNVLAAR